MDDFPDVREWERAMLRDPGWYAHMCGPVNAWGANYHTHGFRNFGLRDLQIVAPVPVPLAMGVFWAVFNIARSSDYRPRDGDFVSLPGGAGRLVAAEEGERSVLRVLLADACGNLCPCASQFVSLQCNVP